MSRRTIIFTVVWLVAFAGAIALDQPIAAHNREHGWEKPGSRKVERSSPTDLPRPAWTSGTHQLAEILKFPGTYWATLVIAAAVAIGHRAHLRAAGIVALAGLLTGVNSLIKWIVGRHRPVTGADPLEFNFFAGGIPGLFGAESNLSFPSGHACLAFANAAVLAILLPRWRWVFFVIATVTATERVVENAHFASDVVAGAGLGILCAVVANVAVERWIRKPRPAVAIQSTAN